MNRVGGKGGKNVTPLKFPTARAPVVSSKSTSFTEKNAPPQTSTNGQSSGTDSKSIGWREQLKRKEEERQKKEEEEKQRRKKLELEQKEVLEKRSLGSSSGKEVAVELGTNPSNSSNPSNPSNPSSNSPPSSSPVSPNRKWI